MSEPMEQIRNVWISGLLDPSEMRMTERYWLYAGDIQKSKEAQKETKKIEKFYKSYHKNQSWRNLFNQNQGGRHHVRMNWMSNPISHSIPADITFFNRQNYKMTVIDTPARVDFTTEVKNALCAFDGAVLVLSSVGGVKTQSISVDKQMMEFQLPRLVFINNLDHKRADPWEVVDQTRSKLQHHSAALQVPIGLGDSFKGLVDLVQSKAYFFHASNGEKVVVEEVPRNMESLVSRKRRDLIKTVSEVDDKLAEAFSSDNPISAADLEEAIRRATIAHKFVPVFMGSAFKYKGLQLLLDGVLNYLPCPTEAINEEKMSVIGKPAHVDFTAEVQSALPAFGSVLILDSDAVDGLQSHPTADDNQKLTNQIPRLVFIRNLNQPGANPWQVVIRARSKLPHHSAALQVPIGLGYSFKGLVDLVQSKAYFFHASNREKLVAELVPGYMEALVSEKRHELIKTVSEVDDKLAEAFNGDKPISAADLQEAICRATRARKFIPVFMGSTSGKEGVQLLLDGMRKYCSCPIEASNSDPIQSKNEEKDTLVALAFTLRRKYDVITYLRIYEGVLRKGDFLTNIKTGKTFKVPDSIEVRKDEIGVPYSYELKEDEMGVPYVIGLNNEVPYSTEPRKDDLGVPHMIGMTCDEVIQEAHAGEIVAIHDVINAPGDTFTDGLVRYTEASSIDISELLSRDSEQVSKV
ncbi:elongation factor G-2, mitochondrial isoform X2 [Medicago truncatula]|uniref:elongation factor G-2, mitochondrial isoform X2 n=1 Tax=Medicago truncatula TaxID=3880 RepID=UPI001968811D|nr:elongation factor G-2, mitochondrial isoform X2 [Medicago truncatula]